MASEDNMRESLRYSQDSVAENTKDALRKYANEDINERYIILRALEDDVPLKLIYQDCKLKCIVEKGEYKIINSEQK